MNQQSNDNNGRRRFLKTTAMIMGAAGLALPNLANALPTGDGQPNGEGSQTGGSAGERSEAGQPNGEHRGSESASQSNASGQSTAEHRGSGQGALGPIKQIDAGLLNVGYVDDGPQDGPVVLLLHGWPYDIYSFAEVVPILTSAGYRVIVPYLRGSGTTRFLSAGTFRNGQPSAIGLDIIHLLDALKIEKPIIGGFDWGARTANVIAALWPERCKAQVSVSGYLIGSPASGKIPLPPSAEYQWWYQFYFATERGKAGYDKNRYEFNKLIWKLASPKWNFDEPTFARTAASFDNPDHVDIVIHNYRWRQGLAEGEAIYDQYEAQLAKSPNIGVPTITMEGDDNGAPHPPASAYAGKFTGKYKYELITGGIGHNLPQEAPKAFAHAIVEVDGFTR